MSREALVAAYSECVTAARLLAPTHSKKVDEGILPVVDYLHINLADFLAIRSIDNAEAHRDQAWGAKKGN